MSRVPALAVDDPDDEEERRLEERVREQQGEPASAASGVPKPSTTVSRPSWLTVPKASSSLRSVCRSGAGSRRRAS